MGRERGSWVGAVPAWPPAALLSPLPHNGLHEAAAGEEGPSQRATGAEEEGAWCGRGLQGGHRSPPHP